MWNERRVGSFHVSCVSLECLADPACQEEHFWTSLDIYPMSSFQFVLLVLCNRDCVRGNQTSVIELLLVDLKERVDTIRTEPCCMLMGLCWLCNQFAWSAFLVSYLLCTRPREPVDACGPWHSSLKGPVFLHLPLTADLTALLNSFLGHQLSVLVCRSVLSVCPSWAGLSRAVTPVRPLLTP